MANKTHAQAKVGFVKIQFTRERLCVASPCCKLLISPNLATAWELAPIPQSCQPASPPACPGPRLIQSNKTRPVSAHIVQQRTVLGGLNNSSVVSAVCCLAASGHIQLRGEGVSDSGGRLYHSETDVEAQCARSDRRMRRSHRGGTVRACIQQ